MEKAARVLIEMLLENGHSEEDIELMADSGELDDLVDELFEEFLEEAIRHVGGRAWGAFRSWKHGRMSASSPEDLTQRYVDHYGLSTDPFGEGKRFAKTAQRHGKAASLILKHVEKEHGPKSAKALRVAGKHAGRLDSEGFFDGDKQERIEKAVSANSTKKFGDYIPKNAKGKRVFEETEQEEFLEEGIVKNAVKHVWHKIGGRKQKVQSKAAQASWRVKQKSFEDGEKGYTNVARAKELEDRSGYAHRDGDFKTYRKQLRNANVHWNRARANYDDQSSKERAADSLSRKSKDLRNTKNYFKGGVFEGYSEKKENKYKKDIHKQPGDKISDYKEKESNGGISRSWKVKTVKEETEQLDEISKTKAITTYGKMSQRYSDTGVATKPHQKMGPMISRKWGLSTKFHADDHAAALGGHGKHPLDRLAQKKARDKKRGIKEEFDTQGLDEETLMEIKMKLKPGQKMTPKQFAQMKADVLAKQKQKAAKKAAPKPAPKEEKVETDDTNRNARILKGQFPWGNVTQSLATAARSSLMKIEKPHHRLKALDKIWQSKEHFNALLGGRLDLKDDDTKKKSGPSLPKVRGVND